MERYVEMVDKGPKYLIDDNLKERVKNVREGLKDKFFYVELDRILYVRKVRGNSNTSREIAAVRRIGPPYDLLNPSLKYILEVIAIKFDKLSEDAKNRVIEHELMHIPSSFDGTLVKHSIEDFQEILEKYGFNYTEK